MLTINNKKNSSKSRYLNYEKPKIKKVSHSEIFIKPFIVNKPLLRKVEEPIKIEPKVVKIVSTQNVHKFMLSRNVELDINKNGSLKNPKPSPKPSPINNEKVKLSSSGHLAPKIVSKSKSKGDEFFKLFISGANKTMK